MQCHRTLKHALTQQDSEACKELGSIADTQGSGLRQLRRDSPSNRAVDPANDHVELTVDLCMRVLAQLPARDLLCGCCAVCHQWRDWVQELSASQLSYRQDFTCRCCGQQVCCLSGSCRVGKSGNAECQFRHVWIAMERYRPG